MRRSFYLAVFTLVGTTIGAGVFALPGLFARFGIWQASLCFWILAGFVMLIQRLYVDVILSIPTSHRLPGYVRLALGKRWGMIATGTYFFPIYGAHIIYLLLGGAFLQTLLQQFGLLLSSRVTLIALFLAVAVAVWGGVRRVVRIDASLALVNVVLFLLLSAAAFAHGPAATRFIPQPAWEAFGLILFALSALAIVPEITELCDRQKFLTRRAVLLGTGLASFVIWVFACAFAYAGGTQLGHGPQSLIQVLPSWGGIFLPLMGLFAITAAYLSTSESMQMSWRKDYHLSEHLSWAVTLFPSFILALCLKDGFVLLATILGTICGGINGVLVGMMRVTIAEKRGERLILGLALIAVFLYGFGMSGQIVSWLFL